jgi:hypothetical protein
LAFAPLIFDLSSLFVKFSYFFSTFFPIDK